MYCNGKDVTGLKDEKKHWYGYLITIKYLLERTSADGFPTSCGLVNSVCPLSEAKVELA